MTTLPGLSRRNFVVRAGGAFATATGLGLFATPARAGPPPVDEFGAEVATTWFDLALELVRQTPGFSPPVASRAFGYAGVALYEALLPGMAGFESLGGVLAGLGPLPAVGRNRAYEWPTGANAALTTTLRGQRRSLFAYLTEVLSASFRGDPVPALA